MRGQVPLEPEPLPQGRAQARVLLEVVQEPPLGRVFLPAQALVRVQAQERLVRVLLVREPALEPVPVLPGLVRVGW